MEKRKMWLCPPKKRKNKKLFKSFNQVDELRAALLLVVKRCDATLARMNWK